MKINNTAKLVIGLAIAFLLIVPGVIIHGIVNRSHLLNHHDLVVGRITGARKGVKGSPRACNVNYSYSVAGKQYQGTTLFKPGL